MKPPTASSDAGPFDRELGSVNRTSLNHHERLWAALVGHADRLTLAADAGADDRLARSSLVRFLRGDVLAHLQAETLYQQALDGGAGPLAAALAADHRVLLSLVGDIEEADSAPEAARCARALLVLLALRIEKEETIVLPALAQSGVDVDSLLDEVVVEMATDYNAQFTYL